MLLTKICFKFSHFLNLRKIKVCVVSRFRVFIVFFLFIVEVN